MSTGKLTRVVGALAEATGLQGASLNELVQVGKGGLLAEVLRVTGDRATLQVFEETTGLAVEEPVEGEGQPLSVELGPGLLGSVLDGIGRPLAELAKATGDFIAPGARAATLDRHRTWRFTPICRSTASCSRVLARVAPMQEKCDAASTPSARISATVPKVPSCVDPPAPYVTEQYSGLSA